MNALICLSKYQDWLEAYSVLDNYKSIDRVEILYLEDKRNNEKSVKSLFEAFRANITFIYTGANCKSVFFYLIKQKCELLESGDIFAAPFIKYRDIWKLCNSAKRKGIVTIHLSETLPDSFGLIGYRLGFRWAGNQGFGGYLKNLIGIPIMFIYALLHKPDICFFNLYPSINNRFVKETKKASVPVPSKSKMDLLTKILGKETRTLIVGGFGYDSKKIAERHNISKYIATSKELSIVVDGENISLPDFINAEDVLLGGFAHRIIGYNSTAICWAYRFGNIEIDCYEAPGLNKIYGYFGYYSRKTLKKCGICLKDFDARFMN